jgi:hypothetical protein
MVCVVLGLYILCWCRRPKIGTNSTDLTQLSRFHLKMETDSSLCNIVLDKSRMVLKIKTGQWIMPRNTTVVLFIFNLMTHTILYSSE